MKNADRESGFSLLEVMIAASVLVVGTLGVLEVAGMNTKVQTRAVEGTEIDSMNTLAMVALGDQQSCTDTFAGLNIPSPGTTVPLTQIFRHVPSGTSPVLTVAGETPPANQTYVSRMVLNSESEVEISYTKRDGSEVKRRIAAPILSDGTKIICSASLVSNVELALKSACEANGGYYNATIFEMENRCQRCLSSEYNAAAAGLPLDCRPISEKACLALNPSVAYWDASTSSCQTCPKAGQILKKGPSPGFDPASDCVDAVDSPALTNALNCAPNRVSFARSPDGTLIGQCLPGTCVPKCSPSLADGVCKNKAFTFTNADGCGGDCTVTGTKDCSADVTCVPACPASLASGVCQGTPFTFPAADGCGGDCAVTGTKDCSVPSPTCTPTCPTTYAAAVCTGTTYSFPNSDGCGGPCAVAGTKDCSTPCTRLCSPSLSAGVCSGTSYTFTNADGCGGDCAVAGTKDCNLGLVPLYYNAQSGAYYKTPQPIFDTRSAADERCVQLDDRVYSPCPSGYFGVGNPVCYDVRACSPAGFKRRVVSKCNQTCMKQTGTTPQASGYLKP